MSCKHKNDFSNEPINREELNSITAYAEKSKYLDTPQRRPLIKLARSVVAKRMHAEDEAVFFYNTDKEVAHMSPDFEPKFVKQPTMLEEVQQFFYHQAYTNIVHIADGASATIDGPNVLRLNASGWTPEDVDAQVQQLPKNSIVIITVTPTIPWADINGLLCTNNVVHVLDCRGDVSQVDFGLITEPPFLLYDAPVVVSGQPSVLHCICVTYGSFFFPENRLVNLSENIFHCLNKASAEGADLTPDTLLRMAAFVKASLPEEQKK